MAGRVTCPTVGQWAKIGLLLALTLIGVVTLATHQGRQGLFDAITWARGHQTIAFVFYVLAFTVGAVIHLPEILLAVSSGYIFDNILVMVIATDLGATMGALFAWFVGRFLLRETFVNIVVNKFPSFAALDALSGTPQAWKIMVLLRIPFVPYIAVNFALSVTQVQCWTYTWTTALGLLPGSLVYGLIGRGVGELADLHEASRKDPTVLALSITGVVACILVFIAVRWYVLRELERGTLDIRQRSALVRPMMAASDSGSQTQASDEDDGEEEVTDANVSLPSPVRAKEPSDELPNVVLRIPGPDEESEMSTTGYQHSSTDVGLSATSSISPSVSPSKRSPKKAPLSSS